MVNSEDDSPLIYGLEFQARALCAQTSANAEPMPIRFLVGTQSLKSENQVHLLEYVEDLANSSAVGASLKKLIFKHSVGEIWDLSCSSRWPNLLATCYASTGQENNSILRNCTLWRMPVDLSSSTIDEDNLSSTSLIKLKDFSSDEKNPESGARKSLWHPEDGNQLLTMEQQRLMLWDVEQQSLNSEFNFDSNKISKSTSKSFTISNMRWSPHSNCSIISLAIGNYLYAKDVRCPGDQFAWSIEAHTQPVRDLDFNPNAQYYLASCGDDCEYKFWDVRNAKEPAIVMQPHSHWVWSVRYNQYHDQLVLTCSSDSRVILSRVASFASQPYGHLLDADQLSADDLSTGAASSDLEEEDATSLNALKEVEQKKRVLKDEVITVYDEHEDSVYAAEWSNADPWIFASLSYDGRLVINRVPKDEKYNLLI